MTSEKRLKRAITLLVISLILGTVSAALPNIFIPGHLMILLFVFAMVLVYAFIIWQIKLKQNWARILFTIIYFLALFGTASDFIMLFTNMPNALVIFNESKSLLVSVSVLLLIERILEGAAVYLLFSKETNLLFKKSK